MNMSKELKKDWLPKLQVRYSRRNRDGKSRMLDEMCEAYEYERKYAIKLLCGGLPPSSGRVHPGATAFRVAGIRFGQRRGISQSSLVVLHERAQSRGGVYPFPTLPLRRQRACGAKKLDVGPAT